MNKIIFAILTFGLSAVFAQNNISFKGDFRFRAENIKEEQLSPTPEAERTRARMRLRFGAQAQVNEDTEVHLRLATGSLNNTDANTTNQDFTDYYSKKAINLDLAYFAWKASDTFSIWGGKTPNPFYQIGNNDLIFDSDLTPEGLMLKSKISLDSSEIFINAAMTSLNERYSAAGGDNTDVGIVSGQLGYNYKSDNFNAGLAAAIHNFSNIKNSAAPAARGNSLTGGNYDHDYKLTTIGLELGTELFATPFSIYGEMVTNTETDDDNQGSVYGVRFGQLKDVKSWSFAIDHRELQKDATVAVLADADSSGGGTDIRSLRMALAYQIAEKTNITLTHFTGKRTISSAVFSPNYQRTMLDFNYSF